MTAFKYLNSALVLPHALIKNRLLFPNALPKTQQGPETFPADPIISFYSNMAKNGAGIICYADMSNSGQRKAYNSDEQHFPMYDVSDPSVENYISQVADNVHFYGSKIIVDVSAGNQLQDVDVVDGVPDEIPPKDLDHEVHIAEIKPERRAMTAEDMVHYTKIAVDKALFYQRMGFDGGYLGLFQGKYGNFLSQTLNTRTDEYGGSIENRMRFPLQVLKEIRSAVGKQFMLVLDINRFSSGLTWEDAITFTEAAAPFIDLIHLRAVQVQTAFEGTEEEYENPKNLEYAYSLKQHGIKTPIAAWTGFQELEKMESILESGAVDMISAGRFQLCNPNLGNALRTGDTSKILPCLLCNKCHGDTLTGPWLARCSVNPQIGLHYRLDKMVQPPESPKTIAVIGGGPAGMAAAMYASERGHHVTLYEKGSELGGQIRTSIYPSFKWPLKRYLNRLCDIIDSSDVEVRCNCEANPKMITDQLFDAVIVAVGAKPLVPPIPGADNQGIWTPFQVYGHESELGKNVVCIGGSETSVETALYLAEINHCVTLITRKKRIASDANPIHYVDSLRHAVYSNPNIIVMEETITDQIQEGIVLCHDKNKSYTVCCDTVIASGGMTPLRTEAAAFSGTAPQVFYIGDCCEPMNIAYCMRSAFAAAMQI